jgi:RNA ligase
MNLSRGLVYCTETEKIVALAFPKFWNINDTRHPETMEENLPNEIPMLLDKLDGSLGIMFEWDGLNHVATRGSFHSDQANWATNWIRTKYPRLKLSPMYTVLSEIIFKENKIVIDYDFEGLVVLGVINIDTGRELSRDDLKPYCRAMGLNLVQEYKKSLSDALKENEKNREGYVLTYPSTGIKVKVKFEEYVRLHKILTGLNVHSVWELLRDGKSATIDEWIADARMPETFKAWVFGVRRELCIKFIEINNIAVNAFQSKPILDQFMPYKESRKKMAAYFTQEKYRPYSGLLFGLLDHKDITPSIWKMVEPSGNAVYLVDGE